MSYTAAFYKTAFVAALVCVGIFAFAVAASAHSDRHSASKSFTLYSVGNSEQFLNHEDDRARGEGNNPFGKFTDVTALAQSSGNGPFPGDQAIFQLTVYSAKDLRTKVGIAVLSCFYNFHHNGYCDATFQLKGGTLTGSGAFSFDAGSFTLAIIGGTGKYLGASGMMAEAPSANHSQRLAFSLN